jgi:hypothetical protein
MPGSFCLAESQSVPKVGKKRSFSSEPWKKIGARVQALEKFGELFPMVGRFSACGSRHWKIRDGFFQGLEVRPCEAA